VKVQTWDYQGEITAYEHMGIWASSPVQGLTGQACTQALDLTSDASAVSDCRKDAKGTQLRVRQEGNSLEVQNRLPYPPTRREWHCKRDTETVFLHIEGFTQHTGRNQLNREIVLQYVYQ